MRFVGCLVAALCLSVAPALASDFGVSEIRGGVMIDDVELHTAPFWIVPRLETMSLNNLHTVSFDVLFDVPQPSFIPSWAGVFRPVIGFDYNLTHESMAHISLNWHVPIAHSGFFVETEVGGAIHNGALNGATPPFRNLGCRGLFYWSANVGYQITDNLSIMATEQHGSQYGICGWAINQGLNYDGIRIGYKF